MRNRNGGNLGIVQEGAQGYCIGLIISKEMGGGGFEVSTAIVIALHSGCQQHLGKGGFAFFLQAKSQRMLLGFSFKQESVSLTFVEDQVR